MGAAGGAKVYWLTLKGFGGGPDLGERDQKHEQHTTTFALPVNHRELITKPAPPITSIVATNDAIIVTKDRRSFM